MFGLGLIIFLGFAALTVDIGFLLVTQRNYQNAADEAALAGAVYLTRPIADPCADISGTGDKDDCARAAAWRYLRDDLGLALTDAFIDASLRDNNTPPSGRLVTTTDGGIEYRLWVATPPSGAGTSASMSTVSDNHQVLFVRVDRPRSPFVAGVLGIGDVNVSAWATAGTFPNRWAVITLRRGRAGTDIDPGDIGAKDIKISGGSQLYVVDGDVGGNYGMRIDGSGTTHLYLDSSDPDDGANAYLIDNISCGNSCWGPSQVTDSALTPKQVKKLPSFVTDPNYQPPPIPLGTVWPNGLVSNAPGISDIPNGDTDTTPYAGPPPDITINAGSVVGGTCAANGPRLGPGTYGDIVVTNNSCLVLDPTSRYTNPAAGSAGGSTPTPAEQAPGIYYITGQIDVRNNALIVGDGVTIIIRPDGTNNQFSPNGVVDINRGLGNLIAPGVSYKLGAWTTKGASPYLPVAGVWDYQEASEADPQLNGIGIAFYVLKPTQYDASAVDTDNTAVIKMTSAGAGIAWRGVTYAARDNVTVSGQPLHDGTGQLVSWTVTFTGSVPIHQKYEGPGDGSPYLIEPCIVVAGSCA
jgi:hypothetical protein